MPRPADPDLERRILDAVQKLWKKGGDKALTMRAVARAAGTSTPTLYQRFASREHLLLGLLRRIQQDFAGMIESCHSPEELCECYLDFARDHPFEFELFFAHQKDLPRVASSRGSRSGPLIRPGVEAGKRKLAEWLGGAPDDYTQLHLALWALTHGTAMLLISETARDGLAVELRRSMAKAVAALLRELAPDRQGSASGRTHRPSA